MSDLKFTIPEILSLLGVAQCIYLLVYFVFRAGYIIRASLPFLYFMSLGLAFFSDFAARFLQDATPYYHLLQNALWFFTVPLAVLLVMQVARITRVPSPWYFLLVPLPLYALIGAYFFNGRQWGCGHDADLCEALSGWFVVIALIMSALCLLTLWLQRGLLASIPVQKFGKERYWLVLSVIIMNVIFLIIMSGYYFIDISEYEITMIRTVLGLCLIYLASTSLFRIYPQSIRILDEAHSPEGALLNDKELDIALQIERLLALEKVYHEPGYGRSDLARELEIPESLLSRIINNHFGKTLPQLFNEHRVDDAKILLRDTDATAKVIATEVGFNSLASFNRVFKEVSGCSPSVFRQSK